MANIPLVDLGAQHRQVAEEVARGFAGVLETTSFILGKQVKEFEEAFAAFVGAKHCVAVANGTDALELALRAAGLGPGDEVIVPTNTFIATALAVARAGATPVLVDCDPVHYMLDLGQAAAKITSRTRAIMPVDLYGQLPVMEEVEAFASKHGLVIVEDAAQAQGAKRRGRGAGTFGVAAGTSFYPGKNLGAYGDGGAVTTGSDEIAAKVRALRNYGSEVKYYHPETGFNSRLDTLQAVVLLAKLKRLAGWNDARRAAARRYDELLADVPDVTLPRTLDGNEHIWHLYVVRVPRRDEVLKKLNADGIGAGIHYPVPVHLQGAFKHLGHRAGDFPVAEKAAGEIISLPMFGEITAEQQARIVESLRRALADRAMGEPAKIHPLAVVETDAIGDGTRIWANAHVMSGARVGSGCNLGEGVFVESGVTIGNDVTIKNGVAVYDGVTIEDEAFLGPHCVFTNDLRPRSGRFKRPPSTFLPTRIGRGATVGANATVVCGHGVGEYAMIAAGAVVTKDVPPYALVAGVPARKLGFVCACGESLPASLVCTCGLAYAAAGQGLRPKT